MKYFLLGCIIAIPFIIYGLFATDRLFIAGIVGTIGIISLLCSGLFTGAFNSGEGIRVIFLSEDKESRHKRVSIAIDLFLFGFPSIVASVFLLLI